MKKSKRIFGKIILGILFLGVISLILMLLWNWLMPAIFGLITISYLQAVGLLILSKILFSGHAWKPRPSRERHLSFDRFKDKWNKMPEEKKEFYRKKMEEKGFTPKED